jgi:hypothetical protein
MTKNNLLYTVLANESVVRNRGFAKLMRVRVDDTTKSLVEKEFAKRTAYVDVPLDNLQLNSIRVALNQMSLMGVEARAVFLDTDALLALGKSKELAEAIHLEPCAPDGHIGVLVGLEVFTDAMLTANDRFLVGCRVIG